MANAQNNASVQSDSSAKAALERSDIRRNAMFARAKDGFEKSALASGSYGVGRSEDGKPTDTRSPHSLGITINGWLVKTVFKRDDAGKLGSRDWRDVEKEARSGALPTRVVVTENHIITAVRELKHVREGYYAEIESTKALVGRIIHLNDSVANKPHPVGDTEISAVISGLRELRPIIEAKDTPLKQIIGLGRLDEAIRRFESALSPSCKNRALELGRACAVLTSVPERLMAWRDKRIAGGVAYTTLRETALRVERDRWVFSQLARFSSSTKRIMDFVEEDGKKKDALLRIRGLLDELDALHRPLRRLRKKKAWSANDQEKLSSAEKSFESMKSEALQTAWADSEKRNRHRKAIRNLECKKSRSAQEDGELSGAKKSFEEMKSEAMRLPWFQPSVVGPLRKTIRQLEGRKKMAACFAEKLETAEKAFHAKKTEAMRCVWANAHLFSPDKNGKKPQHLSGDYGWIHRNIKGERLGDARAKVDSLVLFLDSNKPRFILDELSECPDRYLSLVLAELRLAVSAFEAKDLKTAQKHFAQAALEMRKITFP